MKHTLLITRRLPDRVLDAARDRFDVTLRDRTEVLSPEELRAALRAGQPGESYNIGGSGEHRNLDVVRAICRILDELAPHPHIADRTRLIQFVPDRPGHDRRYAMNWEKAARELGWSPSVAFEEGLRRTVQDHWAASF